MRDGMVDREKVIKGLECCAVGAECDHCPYSSMNQSGHEGCYQMHADAFALLKKQEPVVRCSECKFGKLCLDADGHRLIQCTNTKYPTANVETWPLELDWYCAGGERRDGDT